MIVCLYIAAFIALTYYSYRICIGADIVFSHRTCLTNAKCKGIQQEYQQMFGVRPAKVRKAGNRFGRNAFFVRHSMGSRAFNKRGGVIRSYTYRLSKQMQLANNGYVQFTFGNRIYRCTVRADISAVGIYQGFSFTAKKKDVSGHDSAIGFERILCVVAGRKLIKICVNNRYVARSIHYMLECKSFKTTLSIGGIEMFIFAGTFFQCKIIGEKNGRCDSKRAGRKCMSEIVQDSRHTNQNRHLVKRPVRLVCNNNISTAAAV